MDTPPPVAETAAPTQTVPAGGEQPQRQEPVDFASQIEGLEDTAAMESLLFGGPPPEAATPADAEPAGPASGDPNTQEDSQAPAETTPAGEQPQEAPAEEEEQPPADQPQQTPTLERISLRALHPDDRVLVAKAKDLVREGKAPRLADAIAMLTQQSAGTPEPAPQPESATEEPRSQAPAPAPAQAPVESDSEVARITSQLADLRALRKTAVEEFDRPQELELTAQIEDALAALAEAKSQAIIRSQQATVQEQAINAVIEDIYVAHPESEDPKSFFSYRLTQEVEAYEQAHGPIGRHPAQLRALADKVAREIAPPKQDARATPAPPPPRQNARPLGSSAPGSQSAVRPSPEQLQRLIETADDETIVKLLAS